MQTPAQTESRHGATRLGGHRTPDRRSHLRAVADPVVPTAAIGPDCEDRCHYCQGPETD